MSQGPKYTCAERSGERMTFPMHVKGKTFKMIWVQLEQSSDGSIA